MRATTGDEAKAIPTISVSLINIGYVLKTDLTDATKPVNFTAYSGKVKGSLVLGIDADGSNPVIYMATGSNPADAWNALGGASYTLPAATATALGGVKQSAATADQAAVTVAGADVAALVTSTNSALATIVAKINAILAAERTAGQKATT